MQSDGAAELAALYPAPRIVAVAGRKVTIPKAGIRACSQVVQMAMALAAKGADGDDEMVIVDEHPDEAADLLAFALGIDREWAASLDAIDKVDLGREWLEVNGRFFLQRLAPARARLQQTVLGLLGAGPTSSTGASPTDTPAPTITPPTPSPSGPQQSPAPSGATGAPA